MDDCVFCDIVSGKLPAKFKFKGTNVDAFYPLNPVVEGHLLVVPHRHVEDFTEDSFTSARTVKIASMLAAEMGPVNLITSKGVEATQSVFHLHVHLVPRKEGDGLHLPWTGQNNVK